MKIWAHRGASAHRPENTNAAFELAGALGADGIELDVHLCASGEVVVVHDPDLRRVAGVPLVVRESSLAELRSHDLGANERIPILEEALEAAGDLSVNVELKIVNRHPTGLEEASVRAVKRAGAEHRVLFSCFHPLPLWRIKALMPGAPKALLFGTDQGHHLRLGLHGAGLSLHAVHPEHLCVSPRKIAAWHLLGMRVNAWTVNDASLAREMSVMGVDGLITDAPDLVRDALMGICEGPRNRARAES